MTQLGIRMAGFWGPDRPDSMAIARQIWSTRRARQEVLACFGLEISILEWLWAGRLANVALCRRTVWGMGWHTMLERPRAPTPTTFNIIKAKRRVDAQMQTRHIIYIGHLQPHRCPELNIRMPKCRRSTKRPRSPSVTKPCTNFSAHCVMMTTRMIHGNTSIRLSRIP